MTVKVTERARILMMIGADLATATATATVIVAGVETTAARAGLDMDMEEAAAEEDQETAKNHPLPTPQQAVTAAPQALHPFAIALKTAIPTVILTRAIHMAIVTLTVAVAVAVGTITAEVAVGIPTHVTLMAVILMEAVVVTLTTVVVVVVGIPMVAHIAVILMEAADVTLTDVTLTGVTLMVVAAIHLGTHTLVIPIQAVAVDIQQVLAVLPHRISLLRVDQGHQVPSPTQRRKRVSLPFFLFAMNPLVLLLFFSFSTHHSQEAH